LDSEGNVRQQSIVILTGDSSAGINGSAIDANQFVNLSVQVISSVNTVAGTLKLQISNDAPIGITTRNQFTPVNYVDLPSATVTIAAGAPGMFSVANIAVGYLRAVWTPDGGGSTGTITAQMSSVGV
jgi:phage tail sheath gpL-like